MITHPTWRHSADCGFHLCENCDFCNINKQKRKEKKVTLFANSSFWRKETQKVIPSLFPAFWESDVSDSIPILFSSFFFNLLSNADQNGRWCPCHGQNRRLRHGEEGLLLLLLLLLWDSTSSHYLIVSYFSFSRFYLSPWARFLRGWTHLANLRSAFLISFISLFYGLFAYLVNYGFDISCLFGEHVPYKHSLTYIKWINIKCLRRISVIFCYLIVRPAVDAYILFDEIDFRVASQIASIIYWLMIWVIFRSPSLN